MVASSSHGTFFRLPYKREVKDNFYITFTLDCARYHEWTCGEGHIENYELMGSFCYFKTQKKWLKQCDISHEIQKHPGDELSIFCPDLLFFIL